MKIIIVINQSMKLLAGMQIIGIIEMIGTVSEEYM